MWNIFVQCSRDKKKKTTTLGSDCCPKKKKHVWWWLVCVTQFWEEWSQQFPEQTWLQGKCVENVKIQYVIEKLTWLIKSTDHHLFHLLHAGTNATTRKRLEIIPKDYKDIEGKEFGAQVVSLSILPTEGHGPIKEQRILNVTYWLKLSWNFGFLDHGLHSLQEGLLVKDRFAPC